MTMGQQTKTDWEQMGRSLGPCDGRQTLRATLEAAGLVVNTPDYQRALAALQRGRDVKRLEVEAAAAAREEARLAPYREEARANVLAWGCWEEDGPEGNLEAFLEDCREEATRMADEAEQAAAEAEETARREGAELLHYQRSVAAVNDACKAAAAACLEAGWRLEPRRGGSELSCYFNACRLDENGDEDLVLTVRISDHYAPNGSGWNESAQTQHDRPDVNIVMSSAYSFSLERLLERLD
jgi:hypothetical protein